MKKNEIKAIIEKAINEGRYNVNGSFEYPYDEELTAIVDTENENEEDYLVIGARIEKGYPFLSSVYSRDEKNRKKYPFLIVIARDGCRGEDDYTPDEFAKAFGE